MGRASEHAPSTSPTADFHLREQELAAAHRARRILRHRSLVLHWLGRWFRRSKKAAAAPLPAVAPGQVAVSFAGHATVLIRYASRNIVCDPMLGSWVRGVKRAVKPGLTPEDLCDVQLILISHDHADHLHRDTLARLPRSATVVVPPRAAQRVSDLGFARVVELSPGKSIQDHGVDISTVAVRHDHGDAPALSYVIRGDGPSVYFCGDSGYFSGFAEVGRRFRPDIAILPIGGYAPLSFRDRHMSPLDALYALEDLGARIMIPIHHGAFALSYEQLSEPSRWLAELVYERRLEDFVVELEPGESRVFVPPRPQRADNRAPASSGEPGRSAPAYPGEREEDSGPLGLVDVDGHALPALSPAMRLQDEPWSVVLPRRRAAALALAMAEVELDIVVDDDEPAGPVGEPIAALA